MFWVQFAILLGAILIGIRKGGVALGLIGGLGVAIFTLGFREAPSAPPIEVMLIILAVVSASATLQVAGGLEYLIQLSEKILRAHPRYVTILAPLSTFFLTMCVGTGHAVYALLPVIADVACGPEFVERPITSVTHRWGVLLVWHSSYNIYCCAAKTGYSWAI
jgi:anaerobic C4-dicarboxylate transporter DcuB